MVRRNSLILVLCLVLVAAVALSAFAQYQKNPTNAQRNDGQRQARMGGGGHGNRMMSLQRLLMPPGPRQLQRLYEVVGATEEQKQQIKDLCEQFKNTAKPIMEDRAKALKDVAEQLKRPGSSQGTLESAVDRVERFDKAIVDTELGFWKGLKRILTADQQAKLSQMMEQRAMNGPRVMKRHQGGPGGNRNEPGAPPNAQPPYEGDM